MARIGHSPPLHALGLLLQSIKNPPFGRYFYPFGGDGENRTRVLKGLLHTYPLTVFFKYEHKNEKKDKHDCARRLCMMGKKPKKQKG